MCCGELLNNFIDAIKDDPRIGPAHISLYAALLALGYSQSFHGAIKISNRTLRAQCKLYGCATYYRVLKELHLYGYIFYQPTFDHVKGSRVQLKIINTQTAFQIV